MTHDYLIRAWAIEPKEPIKEFDDSEFYDESGDLPRSGDPGYRQYEKAMDEHCAKEGAQEDMMAVERSRLHDLGFVEISNWPKEIYGAVFDPEAEPFIERLLNFGGSNLNAIPHREAISVSDIFKHIDPDIMRDGESVEDWAARTAMTTTGTEKLASLWEVCGHDAGVFARLRNRNQEIEPIKFLVNGLLPTGRVALLIGGRKTGKTTLLTQLGMTVASGGGWFCGFEVMPEACGGLAVHLYGEDHQSTAVSLLEKMDPEKRASFFYAIPKDVKKPLAEHLTALDNSKVSLLVVDPARAYLEGNEDGSECVSNFFAPLEDFARRKDCAVIVAHHLTKSANPSTLLDAYQGVRGSAVFLDRARVTICLYRRNGLTGFGIPAPGGNPQHNIPPMYPMFDGERRLARDPKTMMHFVVDDTWSAGQSRPEEEKAAEQTQRAASMINDNVLCAVKRICDSGARVTRTGKFGLYESRPEELKDCSRGSVRGAVDRMLAEGRLVVESGALRVA